MIGIQVRAEGLIEAIALYSGARDRWPKIVAKTAHEIGGRAAEHMRKEYRTGGTTETKTAVRTGRLRQAYTFRVKMAPNGVDLDLGVVRAGRDAAVLKYAALQEFGGTVKPKKAGGYLAIPLEAAKTKAGVPRGGPRDFTNTFFAVSRQGNLILFGKPSVRSKRVLPLFVMKREVKVPARPALAPTAEKFRPELERRAIEDLRRAING